MNETLSPQFLRRNAVVEEAPLHNELMLFNPSNSQFYVLNPTMAFTWNRLKSVNSLDDIASAITESFAGVTKETAADDVRRAVDELLALGLIERSI